jgi:flagellar biosynthesis/type III secretory pathway protein FliH
MRAKSPHKRLVIAASVLVALILGAGALGAVSYVQSQEAERQALLAEFAKKMQLSATAADKEKAAAITAQKQRDAERLRRVVKRLKRKAKREVQSAFASGQSEGYSSGSAAGYSSGSSDGYEEGTADGYNDGLYDGSDELECSDDVNVSWLPYC